jgi:hypothetical protein
MDRVGGWYKRKSQWVVLGLSALVTIVVNVDTLSILRQLSTQSGLRDALVAQAKTFADRPQVALSSSQPAPTLGSSQAPGISVGAPSYSIEGGDKVVGKISFNPAPVEGLAKLSSSDPATSIEPAQVTIKKGDDRIIFQLTSQAAAKSKNVQINLTGAAEGTATVHIAENLEARFKTIQNQLDQLNLPLGWYRASTSLDDGSAPPKEAIEFRKANFLLLPTLHTLGGTIQFHIVGWLLTAIAASLGAPFWFDTLNKFMAIRSVGKAPEEAPKSPKEVPTPLGPGQSQQVADVLAATRRR